MKHPSASAKADRPRAEVLGTCCMPNCLRPVDGGIFSTLCKVHRAERQQQCDADRARLKASREAQIAQGKEVAEINPACADGTHALDTCDHCHFCGGTHA